MKNLFVLFAILIGSLSYAGQHSDLPQTLTSYEVYCPRIFRP